MKGKKDGEIIIHWSLRKTLTAVCGLFFIPALVLFLVSLTFRQTVINPAYYKTNFRNIDAYNRMINQGIPSLILKTHISNNPLTDTVAKDVATLLFQKFVDPSWLEEATNRFIDATINYLTDKTTEIELNLSDAREYLNRASSGLFVVREFIPTCEKIKDDKQLSVLCTDKMINPDEVIQDIDGIRREIEAINLKTIQFDEVVSLINADVNAIRTFAKNVHIYLAVSLIVIILSVVGVIALQWRNLMITIRSLTFFTGAGSLLTFLLGLVTHQFVPKTIGQAKEIILSPSIRAIIQDFIHVSISGVFERLELYACVVMILSFLIFGLTYMKRR